MSHYTGKKFELFFGANGLFRKQFTISKKGKHWSDRHAYETNRTQTGKRLLQRSVIGTIGKVR